MAREQKKKERKKAGKRGYNLGKLIAYIYMYFVQMYNKTVNIYQTLLNLKNPTKYESAYGSIRKSDPSLLKWTLNLNTILISFLTDCPLLVFNMIM